VIIKRRVTRQFVQLDNSVVRDKRLSLDEHGMLHYLLSLPDDWEVKPGHLEKYWSIGRDKRRRIFRALVKTGWARLERIYADDGVTLLGSRWIIGDEPGAELTEDELAAQGGTEAEDADEVTTTGTTAAPESKGPDALVSADRETPFQAAGSPDRRVTRPPENTSPLRRKTLDEDREDTNTSPPGTAPAEPPAVVGDDDDDGEPPPKFGELLSRWPADNVASTYASEKSFHKLSDAHKGAALAGIRLYLADCRSKGQTRLCDLRTYLDERRWERFAGKPGGARMFVAKRGTPQAIRWRDHFAKNEPQKLRMFDQMMMSHGGYTTPTEWPPSQQAAE
jgi:hypothetical protein